MASERRIERLNKVVAQLVAEILERDFRYPKQAMITVRRVNIAGNMITAEVFFTVLPESEDEQAKQFLDQNIYEIQQALNKRLLIRPVPKLIFKIDKGQEAAERVYRLLGETKEGKNKKRAR